MLHLWYSFKSLFINPSNNMPGPAQNSKTLEQENAQWPFWSRGFWTFYLFKAVQFFLPKKPNWKVPHKIYFKMEQFWLIPGALLKQLSREKWFTQSHQSRGVIQPAPESGSLILCSLYHVMLNNHVRCGIEYWTDKQFTKLSWRCGVVPLLQSYGIISQ